mgnify:CR=1 FL=1
MKSRRGFIGFGSVKKESQRDKQLKHYKSTFGAEPKFAAFKKDVKETNDPLLRPEKKVCNHDAHNRNHF